MPSEGNKDISTEAVSMEQSSTSAGAKRKRGRPRKCEYPSYELPQRAQPIQSIPPLQSTQGSSNIRQDGVQGNRSGQSRNSASMFKTSDNQGNSGKDDILGKRFVGKMTNEFPGLCLITVKVKENQVLKGWVPNLNNLSPITSKDDLMPELPMLRPSKVQKQAFAIPTQAGSGSPAPIHLEDVTLAKPLQMRRPVDKTSPKHAIPLVAKPYMSSGVVAAVPVSVSASNVEMETSSKQDSECMISQSPVAAVPITSVRPVFESGKQDNQNELVGEKFNDFQKDSESSNGTEDSSVKAEKPNAALVDVVVKDSPVERQLLNVQGTDSVGESSGGIQHANTTVNDEIKMALGTRDEPNSANCDHQVSKELSDNAEKSDLLNTQNVLLKGADDSQSVAPDVSTHEHEMKIDSK